MLVKKGLEQDWKKCVEINSEDPYSKACIDYMVAWAELMEEELAKNHVLTHEVAEKLSHDADTDGITGFMYDMSRQYLGHFWQYGDDLTNLLGRKMTSMFEMSCSEDELVDKLKEQGFEVVEVTVGLEEEVDSKKLN